YRADDGLGSRNLLHAFRNMRRHPVDVAIGAVVDDEHLHAVSPFRSVVSPPHAQVDLRGQTGPHRRPQPLDACPQCCVTSFLLELVIVNRGGEELKGPAANRALFTSTTYRN